jgi:ubiquitin carboxyl-terminal hydrolase 14
MRNLFAGMGATTEPIPPFVLLHDLRNLAPQFAEQDGSGRFAQQGESWTNRKLKLDADEAWTQIISALRASLPEVNSQPFIDQYMGAELEKSFVYSQH